MLSLKVLLLCLVGACNIIMAILVLARGARKPGNQSFFLASLAMAGWVFGVALFLLSDNLDAALWIARAFYAFPLLIGVGLILFALTFSGGGRVNPFVKAGIFGGFLIVLIPLLGQSGFLTEQVVQHSWGKEVVLNKAHYLLYTAYLAFTYGGTLWVTYVKSKTETGLYAAQARMFFWGFLITFFIGTGFNLVLPWLGNYRLIWIGPYCTAIFMVAIAYSIIRHHMFNIRSVVARSLAYVLSISVLIIVYTSLIYSLARLLDNSYSDAGLGTNLLNAALLAVMMPVYVPVKRFFDRATSRVFYRDSYEPQTLINDLNGILVKATQTPVILRRASDLLESTIKVYKAGFVILPQDKKREPKYYDSKDKGVPHSEVITFAKHLETASKQAFFAEDPAKDRHANIYGFMNRYGWAVAIRMATRSQGVGYLLVGYKLSGSSYAQQDKEILGIMADELALAIQNSLRHEEIMHFNETLQQEVEDATRRLRHTNAKLKSLDETKDEFISMASHQLRTPLTSVKGYVSMVLEGDAGELNEQQRKLLSQAFISSQHMNYLISDLLNVSRLRTGKFLIETSPVYLPDVVAGEIDQLREIARAKGQELVYEKPADFPTLELDETKIRQVIMNFVDNALHYTPEGGTIRVELEALPRSIELRVVDNGLGVPKADQHKLFGKFFRADNARRARPDGTGLGLFMAKKVIVAQGGAIIFRSQEGKGSTFGFTFPLPAVKKA